MKIFKRTPQSEIPLTVHRRVGRGEWGKGCGEGKGCRRGVCVCVFVGGGGEGGEIMNSIWNYITYL